MIFGAAQDIPRALQHPAVVTGRLHVASVVAIDIDEIDDDRAENATSTLADLVRSQGAGAILIAGPVGASVMRRVADIAILNGCELLAVMPTEVLAGHDPVVVWSGESPLVQLARVSTGSWRRGVKRAVDILGSVAGLVIAAPVLAVLAIMIKLESPGPVLFPHTRVGFRGRRFQCLKLRTMCDDADEWLRGDPEMYEEYRRNHFKIPEERDPRVTRLGRILRRTSLDEIPQLWNVLVGDMALVGPRPVVEEELSHYTDSRNLFLSVRPGLTGAWAVKGRHGVGYPERCDMELEYVRSWSLSGDVVIMLATARAVLYPGTNAQPVP